MSAPRHPVLLVEDDATVRRWVAMALEDGDVQLHEAASLAEARRCLAQQAFALVITDLMLPDGHGLELLHELASAGTAGAAAPARAVFSAGIDAGMRGQLAAIGVRWVLEKPVSLAVLTACVEEALASAATAAVPSPTGAPRPGASAGIARDPGVGVGPAETAGDAVGHAATGREATGRHRADREAHAAAPAPTADPTATLLPAGWRAAAVATHFGGDAALYEAFAAASLAQLQHDIAAGDAALADADAAALRRLAHNLKSALRLLGDERGAEQARLLEAAAQRVAAAMGAGGREAPASPSPSPGPSPSPSATTGSTPPALAGLQGPWQALSLRLQALIAAGSGPDGR